MNQSATASKATATALPKIPLVDLNAQYQSIKQAVNGAIHEVVESSGFILGKAVQNFEKEFAAYCGAAQAIGVGNGTDAITLALRALGVGPGDEVITTANTFIGTTEPIGLAGAKPVFCDIDPLTYNLDPDKLEQAITEKTRAVIAVHLYGQPAPIEAIKKITEPRGIALVEDAAQAHGAEYHGQRIGSLGHAACFSFYPGKNLGAYGDGGAVVTNSSELADRVRMLRNHGRHQKYEHEIEGVNSRLDELQAAILRVKLRHLDTWNGRRRHHAQQYTRQLAGLGVETPIEQPGVHSVYHLYVIRTPHRDALREFLGKQGISTGIHYPLPLHLQPAYRHLGHGIGDFPAAEAAAKEILSLPMYPEMTESDIDRICEGIREFMTTRVG